jgi:hypothetical protein
MKTKNIEKIRKNQMFLRSKTKFQVFLKQKNIIHTNIK